MGVYDGHDVIKRVQQMQARLCFTLRMPVSVLSHPCVQPHIKVVMMDSGVEHGLSQIASALGLPPVADVARNSADWPFAD